MCWLVEKLLDTQERHDRPCFAWQKFCTTDRYQPQHENIKKSWVQGNKLVYLFLCPYYFFKFLQVCSCVKQFLVSCQAVPSIRHEKGRDKWWKHWHAFTTWKSAKTSYAVNRIKMGQNFALMWELLCFFRKGWQTIFCMRQKFCTTERYQLHHVNFKRLAGEDNRLVYPFLCPTIFWNSCRSAVMSSNSWHHVMRFLVSDTKRVEINGVCVSVLSSHGRVQKYRMGKVCSLWWKPAFAFFHRMKECKNILCQGMKMGQKLILTWQSLCLIVREFLCLLRESLFAS